MPQRRDQLPADAINPNLPLDENERTADWGPTWHDHAAWLMTQFLDGAEDGGELSDWILGIIESRDVKRFEGLMKSFELALDGIPAHPFSRSLKLAADYHLEAGDGASNAGLMTFLSGHGLNVDESYARELTRRLGRS